MILLGIVLAVLGFLLGFGLLVTLGVICLVIGIVLLALGHFGHPVGPRSHYW